MGQKNRPNGIELTKKAKEKKKATTGIGEY